MEAVALFFLWVFVVALVALAGGRSSSGGSGWWAQAKEAARARRKEELDDELDDLLERVLPHGMRAAQAGYDQYNRYFYVQAVWGKGDAERFRFVYAGSLPEMEHNLEELIAEIGIS